MSEIPTLRSERLRLRGHVEADLDAAAAMWSDPDVVRFIGGRPFTREQVWHRLLRYIGHWSVRPYGYWAVEEEATRRFVGEIGLADWKRQGAAQDMPETGWVLVPATYGRGYASEALEVVLDWSDAQGIAATFCIIGDANLPSIRLAERFGYTRVEPSPSGSAGATGTWERRSPVAETSLHEP